MKAEICFDFSDSLVPLQHLNKVSAACSCYIIANVVGALWESPDTVGYEGITEYPMLLHQTGEEEVRVKIAQ